MTTNLDETRPVSTTPNESGQPESISAPAETAASPVIEEMIVSDPALPKKRRGCARAWVTWTLIALGLLCVIAGLSGWGGYRAGNQIRNQNARQATQMMAQTQFAVAMQEIDAGRFRLLPTRLASFREWPAEDREISPEVALELQVQFELAQSDVNEKRYDAARARLEWIIEWNPGYPGVTDLLAEVLYQMSVTATPTLAPTLTPVPATPTPDTRGIEKLFSDAQQAYLGGNWTLAIETALALRKRDEAFKAVQVDGMLYVALRYRGLDKIKGSGKTDATITEVDLEGGMYDLRLAESFGPLDVDALKYRRWAQWYIAGSSFWNVDWKRAMDYFALVSNEAPYLVDVNQWPAIERYRYALIRYGDQLASQGDCAGASEQYAKALELGPNPALEATATAAASDCSPAGPPETVVPIEETPLEQTPVGGTPEATPTLPPTVPPAGDTPTIPPTVPPVDSTPTTSPPTAEPSVTTTP
jgi:predicted negative regulator of RcsB-dependent stress response